MKMIFRCLTIFCVIGVINCSAVRNKRSQSFEVTASGTGLDHDIDDFFASSEFPDTQEEDNDYKDTRNKAVMTNQLSDVIDEKTFRSKKRKNKIDEIDENVDKNIKIADEMLNPLSFEDTHRLGFDYQCTACHWGAEILFKYHKMGWPPGNMIDTLGTLCGTFKIQSEAVCKGIVRSVGQQLFAVLDLANDTVSPKDLCGMVYGGSCALQSKRLNDWFLDIPDLNLDPPPTPPPVWPDHPTASTEKILHLSDTHIQLDYTNGTSNTCNKPICCSTSDGRPSNLNEAAGPFGDYHCDLPVWTFEELISQAKDEHPDIKYIFLTGDFPAHDIWRQNRSLNIESVLTVVQILQKHFPEAKVFPAIGNHESFPVNMFPDPTVNGRYSPSWLYSNMAEIYKGWLPDKEQQATLKDGGYYSVLMRPNLRVISINTNFCNNLNFWLLLNFADPHYHLHWLYKQLHKAEMNKEKVYILGHIPPGSESCLDRWAREYNRLVYRFRNTIIGQFFGHTHFDEFELFFAPRTSANDITEVSNVAYLAPSQTPHDGLNPAYRIYTIDGNHSDTTHLILDHATFWMNLTESNEEMPDTKFLVRLEYSAINDYGLTNLSPKSWHNLVERMAVNDDDFDKYRRFYSRSGPFYTHSNCDKTCREELLCSLVTSRHSDKGHCKNIKRLIKRHKSDTSRTWWSYLWSSNSQDF